MKRYHQISERQQEELTRLGFSQLRDVREEAREIKEEYDQALAILRQDPDDFFKHWLDAEKNKNDRKYMRRVQICLKVQEDLGGAWIPVPNNRAGLPPGKLHILRLAQGRGSPDFKQVGPDAATVEKKAAELIKQDWHRYLVKRRNTRYPKALLDDLASAFGISLSTARRRLDEVQFALPSKCRYLLR